MSINNKRSYTEYTVTQPTTDFAIGFDDFDEGGKDNILVTLNGVLVESLGYAAIRKNESTVTITPAITEGTVRLTRETDIDEPFHKFTAGALFSAKSMDENFQQVRHSQQEVRDGFVFLEYNTNGIVQASKEATAQAKVATVEATASAVRAESAADTAVQAVGSLQGVVNAATTATTNANTATATANTAASQATATTTSAQNAALAANTAKQEATTAAANANAATVDTLAATGRAIEAADVVADLVVGKVRAQDVSTVDGSTQDVKNTEFRNELDALPFEGGVLADTFVTVTANGLETIARTQRSKNSDSTSLLDFHIGGNDYTNAFTKAITHLNNKGGGTLNVPDGIYPVTVDKIVLRNNIEIVGSKNTVIKALPYSVGGFSILHLEQVSNISLKNLTIDGSRLSRIVPNSGGKYYKDYNSKTEYSVGDYTTLHWLGVKILTVGSYQRIQYTEFLTKFQTKKVGDTFTHGGMIFEVVEAGVGEWGNAIGIRSCKNIHLENLILKNCWGDGLEVSRTLDWVSDILYDTPYLKYCENITAKNIEIYNCRRQGMSLLSLKNSTFEKITIHGISGTAPECAIDFEPDHVNDKLSNIVIRDLVTYDNAGSGVIFALQGFYNVDFEQTKERLIQSEAKINNHPNYLDKAVLDCIKEGLDDNKISVTLDNWQNLNGVACNIDGAMSGRPRGFVRIINSHLIAEGGDKIDGYNLGAVYCSNISRNHPKILIEDSTLQGNTLNQRAMVYSNEMTQLDVPAGGYYLKNIKIILNKEIVDDALICIRNTTKKTQDFADIVIDNCYQYPKDTKFLVDLGGSKNTLILPNNVVIRNITQDLIYTCSNLSTNLDSINISPLKINRANNELLFVNIFLTYFALGVGTRITFKNDLCDIGSDKFLMFRTNNQIAGIEWSSNAAYSKEILIAPQGELVLEVLAHNRARVVRIDNTSLDATKSKDYYSTDGIWKDVTINNLGAGEISSIAFVLHAGADWSDTKVSFKGVLPKTLQYDVTSSGGGAYLLEIKNVSTTAVTYNGKVKVTTI